MTDEQEISSSIVESEANIVHQPKELLPDPVSFPEFLVKFIVFNVFIFGTLYIAVATSTTVVVAFVIQIFAIFVYITWGFIAANNLRLRQEARAKSFFRRPFVQGCGTTLYSVLYLMAGSSLFGLLSSGILVFVLPFSLLDPFANLLVSVGFFQNTINIHILLKLVAGTLGAALLASWLAAILANGLKKGTREVCLRLLPSSMGLAINALPYGIAYVSMAVVAALIPSISAVMESANAFGNMSNSEFGIGFELLKAMPWFMLPPVSAGVLLIFYRRDTIAFFKERQSPSLCFVSLTSSPLSIWTLCRKTLTGASVVAVIVFVFFPIIDGLKGTVGVAAIKPAMSAYDNLREWMDGELDDGVEAREIVDKIGEGYWNSEFPKDGLTHIMPKFENLMKDSDAKVCRIRLTSRVLAPELEEALAPKVIKGDGSIWQNKIAYCMRVICTSEKLPQFGEGIWLFSSHNSDNNYWMAQQNITSNVLFDKIRNAGGFCTKEGLLADKYQG